MALSDEMMKRFGELSNKKDLTDEETKQLSFIMECFVIDMHANEPEKFNRLFGKYRVSREEFIERTGKDPAELLKKQ
jgi:hypothetical protein